MKTNNKKLQSLDSLFGEEQTENGITEISIHKLESFKNHPFKLYEGQRLDDMVESIKELGVITPIIVKKIENSKYLILAGHNRTNAAKLAGLETIPAIIKENLTEDEAMLIVTETNLMQRSFTDMMYSERAKALKAHYDAMSRQGARTDLIKEIKSLVSTENINEDSTLTQVGARLRTDEKIGQAYNLSKNTVARYIRLTYLNDKLLNRVDEGKISFIPAVTISYLKQEEQEKLEKLLKENNYKVNMKKAELLKAYSKSNKLTEQVILNILVDKISKNNNSNKTSGFKLKTKIISKYFNPEQKQEEIEEIIEKALNLYFEEE